MYNKSHYSWSSAFAIAQGDYWFATNNKRCNIPCILAVEDDDTANTRPSRSLILNVVSRRLASAASCPLRIFFGHGCLCTDILLLLSLLSLSFDVLFSQIIGAPCGPLLCILFCPFPCGNPITFWRIPDGHDNMTMIHDEVFGSTNDIGDLWFICIFHVFSFQFFSYFHFLFCSFFFFFSYRYRRAISEKQPASIPFQDRNGERWLSYGVQLEDEHGNRHGSKARQTKSEKKEQSCLFVCHWIFIHLSIYLSVFPSGITICHLISGQHHTHAHTQIYLRLKKFMSLIILRLSFSRTKPCRCLGRTDGNRVEWHELNFNLVRARAVLRSDLCVLSL